MKRLVLLAVLACMAGCHEELPSSADGRKDVEMKLVNVKPFAFGEPNVVLLVTGGTQGMLEVCNCSGPMPGGLSRRSGLVDSYRKRFPNTVLVDIGDAFGVDPAAIRNEYILRGYEQIGYDAVTLGDQEWAAGRTRLAKLIRANTTPALSTAVTAPNVPAQDVFKRNIGGIKLAIVTETTPLAFHFVPQAVRGTLTFKTTDEVEHRIKSLKALGYVVVLVAHAGEDDIESIAAHTAADIVLRGHTAKTDKRIEKIDGKPVVKVGGWDYVGAVAIKASDGKVTGVEYRPELVTTSWPLNGKLLLTYQAYAHAAMRKQLDAERKDGLKYVAAEECGKCHEEQLENWKKTRHAHAYATLQNVKRTGDPDCVMCHTSGFGTKNGFYTLAKTPNLVNVNCQDCHRFNADEHRAKGFIYEPVSQDICQTCHTPITDPKFNFKTKRPKIQCPVSKGHVHAVMVDWHWRRSERRNPTGRTEPGARSLG